MMFGGAPAKAEAADGHGDKAEAADDEAADEGEGGGEGGHGGGEKEAPLDVPPLLVNLRTADGAPHFLKVHVMLVPGAKSSSEKLKDSLPVLLDTYQPFLRELRPEDLSGSAAVFRIKEELLIRSRDALGDGQVKEILVQDLIQQ
jgi:flagellar FliL protein